MAHPRAVAASDAIEKLSYSRRAECVRDLPVMLVVTTAVVAIAGQVGAARHCNLGGWIFRRSRTRAALSSRNVSDASTDCAAEGSRSSRYRVD